MAVLADWRPASVTGRGLIYRAAYEPADRPLAVRPGESPGAWRGPGGTRAGTGAAVGGMAAALSLVAPERAQR